MKFVKALNQGIITDLGIGKHVYNINLEGCEIEDSIASKIKDVFGHLVEVTDIESGEVVEKVEVLGNQIPSEGATPIEETTPEVVEEVIAAPEVFEEVVVAPEVVEEVDVVPEVVEEVA